VASKVSVASYVIAIDQGTTSTRAIIFDRDGRPVASDQLEHRQIYPQSGWVEHDAEEIWQAVQSVGEGALKKAGLTNRDIAAVGVTNQRETTVVWDKSTGRPVHNAIVWQDTRTEAICRALESEAATFRTRTGLPISTYFSGPKLKWLLDNIPGLRDAAEAGNLLFGTIDSWLLWKLTGEHYIDATNASRTLMMNIHSLQWDDELVELLNVPRGMLPRIGPSSGPVGTVRGGLPLEGVVVSGVLGDQQAALFGQTCFSPGEAKNTYGTGCFMLMNTGEQLVASKSGLLTTLAYQLQDRKPVYALEGSVAIAGALVQWLRDNLGLIQTSAEVEELARSVEDNGGIYFVPAFSGLFAPHWRPDARGAILGMTRYVNKGHIARAALEATAFQTREVLEAMERDGGVRLTSLKVDGGMVGNELLMQFQADVLGVPVVRPQVPETTALGVAYAAGLAAGYWADLAELRQNWHASKQWMPRSSDARRDETYSQWKKAVSRTFNWVD
jgi:glycerol kinase